MRACILPDDAIIINLGFLFYYMNLLSCSHILLRQDVKNEAEAYMLKELSFLKWQEKETKLAHEDTDTKLVQLQANAASLEENLKTKRYMLWNLLQAAPASPSSNIVKKVLRLKISVYSYLNVSNIQMHM